MLIFILLKETKINVWIFFFIVKCFKFTQIKNDLDILYNALNNKNLQNNDCILYNTKLKQYCLSISKIYMK